MARISFKLRRIIHNEDDTISYGQSFTFYCTMARGFVSSDGDTYNGNYIVKRYHFEPQNLEAGTNLYGMKTDLQSGDEWQAFDDDGNKLGFIIGYSNNWQPNNKECWYMRNEEIGCGIFDLIDSTEVRGCYLTVNPVYLMDTSGIDTLDKLLELAANNWEDDGLTKQYQMSAPNYSLFNFIGWSDYFGHYITTLYDDELKGVYSMRPKMEVFSSWYKLITGKYWKEGMFSSNIKDSDEVFYFGRVLDWKRGTVNPSFEDSSRCKINDANDPGYIFTDYQYGTDPGYLIKYFRDRLTLENETTLGFTSMRYGMYLDIRKNTLDDEGQSITYKLSQRNNSVDGLTDGDGYPVYTSYIDALLYEKTYWKREHPGIWGLFISPDYNEWPAAEFEKLLKEKEADDWTKLLDRCLIFTSAFRMEFPENMWSEYYNFERTTRDRAFIFSGWLNLTDRDHWDNIVLNSTSYVDGDYTDENAFCNIDTAEKWLEILTFAKRRKKEPFVPGGNFSGGDGGSGTGDRTGDDILPPDYTGYTTGEALIPWDIGNNSEYLNGIRNWLADTSLIGSYNVATKQSTICALKRFIFPFSPKNETGEMFIVGIDGRKFLYKDSLGTSEIYWVKGSAIEHQYDHYDLFNGYYTITNFFDSFLDYSPYTKIKLYLPFAGVIDLNPSEVVGIPFKIDVGIDWITGNIVYNVVVKNSDVESVLYTANGNCSVDIPLSNVDFNGRVSSMLNATITAAGSIVGATMAPATGGASLALAGASATAGFMNAGNMSATFSQVSGNNISNNGGLSPLRAYLIIERPTVAIPEDFGSHYGFAASISGLIGDFTGYTEVSDVHLENVPCLSEEADEIDKILKAGFLA